MVKRIKDCEEEVGLPGLGEPPVVHREWYAYRGGKAFGPFPTELLAKVESWIVERVADPDSQLAYDDYWKKRRLMTQKASQLWYESLREDYANMPEKMFNVIYSRAYDKAHSDGWDAVAEEFEELADFANDVLQAQFKVVT